MLFFFTQNIYPSHNLEAATQYNIVVGYMYLTLQDTETWNGISALQLNSYFTGQVTSPP